jgi:hypothetical protein
MTNAIIAVNPQQMAEAQGTAIGWVERKLANAIAERDLADGVLDALTSKGLRSEPAKALVKKAAVRVRFYEKVRTALQAGYYIIPPFDIQLFAIRTDRAQSPDERSDSQWEREQSARSLPVGEGRYVSPTVSRSKVATETRKNHDGTAREVAIYANDNWRDVDLPVRALKPQIIEEVGRALEARIFDALGIAPAYRAADPIIAGQIKRPDGKGVLTFFVAWWLDEADL